MFSNVRQGHDLDMRGHRSERHGTSDDILRYQRISKATLIGEAPIYA